MSLEFSPDPRQESEARITALLLGEITGAEAASLLETIEADPQLAALYERLKKTVVLVQEVSANPAQPVATPGANPATPLKLSEERRQKLLAQFKTVKPKEFARVEKRSLMPSWVMPVGIAAAIVALLSTLAIPNFIHARFRAQQAAIVNNLRQLDGAKQEWALENHAPPDAMPTFKEIEPYMGRGGEHDPQASIAGEKYILGRMDQAPVAVAEGKKPTVFTLDGHDEAYKQQPKLALKIQSSPANSTLSGVREFEARAKPAAPAPAPQQLAQNNRQQIYLPPADNNGASLTVSSSAHFGNNAKNVTMADGSVQQFSTSGLRSAASGEASNNVLLFPLDDTVATYSSMPTAGPNPGSQLARSRGVNDSSVQQFGIAGGGGAGNTLTLNATNTPNFSFYRDINGNGANAGKPEQASGFDNSSQLYSSTNGVIGNNAYAGDPAWLGVLNSPEPRSPSNYFIGRFDSLSIPPGSNLDLDKIHNQANLQNNSLTVPVGPAPAPGGNVQLSFNTQPNPALPQAATVVTTGIANSGLADQLNEPQIAAESGRQVSAATTLGISEAKPAAQQNQGVGQAEVPLLGDTPGIGTVFGKDKPSQAGEASNESFARRLQERISAAGSVQTTDSFQEGDRRFKTPQSPHGAQLLTQHAEPAKRPQGVTPLLGSRAPEAETAAASPPPAPVAAPPLPSESIPDQFAVKQEEDGRLTSGLRLPATTPPSDDLSLQKNNTWAYGNANPDKVKNFGSSASASAPAPNQTLVNDGKLLFEAGRLDEAEAKMQQAYKENSSDVSAQQYLQAIQQKRNADAKRQTELASDEALKQVEKSWTRSPAPSNKQPPLNGTQFGTITSTNFTTTYAQSPQNMRSFGFSQSNIDSADVLPILQHLFPDALATNSVTPGPMVSRGTSVQNPQQSIPFGNFANDRISRDDGANRQSLASLYDTKKKELADLQKSRDMVELHVFQEGVEQPASKSSKVDVVERAEAEPASGPTLRERVGKAFTGTVERRAVVKVDRDVNDVAGVGGRPNMAGVYDPHFTQSEFEAIQSEKVLDQVVDKLNLRQTWADQNGGKELTASQARTLLKKNLDLKAEKNTSLVDIGVKAKTPDEAARIANEIAETYSENRKDENAKLSLGGVERVNKQLTEMDLEIREKQSQMAALNKRMGSVETLSPEAKVATPDVNDAPLPKPVVPPPVPQPEVFTSTNAFSTFSMNIADVSFKLAAASLEKGMMPDPASIRSEEFINAFDYRDPEAPPGVPIAFAWERARYPFAQNRDLLRFSLKTAATGRAPGRPLNIVLLLDNSGSMERADRVQIIREALRVLASQLQPQDTLSIVTFARTPRLFVDGVPGNQAANVAEQVSDLTPQGGTNLEDAMRLAYETALRHYLANGINRVVLLTDGAANLGNVDPASLKQSVEAHRKQGIALDCFGIGWEGYNDDLLEVLARNGDGRYGFLNSPEEAANGFAHQLAGALNVAAEDVKVQVEFNPRRVTLYRQIGYAKLQLTKEQFRDNTVAAAQVGAAEAGNALYALQVDPNGDGPLATVRVRYKVPGTQNFEEHEWSVPYAGNALSLEQSSPAMRLAATASAFSEWLANSPYAAEVTPDALLQNLSGVPATYAPDARPQQLEWMLRQAKSLTGK